MRIDAADAVELPGRRTFPVSVKRAHTRLAENVAAHAGNGEVRANTRELAVVGHCQAGTAVVRGHQAHGVGAVFSGEADAGRGIADVTREKQIHWRTKEIFVL